MHRHAFSSCVAVLVVHMGCAGNGESTACDAAHCASVCVTAGDESTAATSARPQHGPNVVQAPTQPDLLTRPDAHSGDEELARARGRQQMDALVAGLRTCQGSHPTEAITVTFMRQGDGSFVLAQIHGSAASEAERACVAERARGFTYDTELPFVTVIAEVDGSSSYSTGRDAPLEPSALDRGADPRRIAESCAGRGDAACVVRMLSGLPNLTPAERATLLWAYALRGDVASVRRLLTEVAREHSADAQFMHAQAWLWRMEHSLPAGEIPPLPAFWSGI